MDFVILIGGIFFVFRRMEEEAKEMLRIKQRRPYIDDPDSEYYTAWL